MLWLTNWVQSFLPFWAQKIADNLSRSANMTDMLYLVGMAFLIFISRTLSRLFFFYPARVLERDMKMDIVERLEITSPPRYQHRHRGELYQIICNDLEHVRALIGFALLQVGNVAIALLVLLPKLATFESRLFYALIPLVISFVLFTWIVGTTRHHHTRNMEIQGEVQNNIIEAYNGKTTIKNFHREETFELSFARKSREELMAFYHSGIGVAWSIPLIPLGIGISMVVGSFIIQQQNLSASSLILFSGFIYLLMEPLSFLSWIGVVFASGTAAWKRIRKLGHELEQELDNEKIISDANNFPILDYFGTRAVLPYVTNEWTAYVGETGHGKTVAMEKFALWLKQNNNEVAYVAQNPYLYNDKIGENLFLQGFENAIPELRQNALDLIRIFSLEELGLQFFDLEVGEHGRRLSGGQIKRICLIRTILSPANFLIWDDPFSSVDVVNERDILLKLRQHPLMKNRTLILTSHRLTTVRYCDHIIFLNKDQGIGDLLNKNVLLDKNSEVYGHFEKQMV